MRANLRTKVYEAIKGKILFFELKPGEKLMENDIASELGTSRTPVREALLLLSHEKLVDCDSRLGFVVRKMTSKEVEEYFAIRLAIERFAIPMIINGVRPAHLEELETNIREAQAAIEHKNLPDIIQHETRFHEILYKATDSTVLVETLSSLVDKFHWLRAIALSAPSGASLSVDGHRQILEALKKKDAEMLAASIEEHMRHAQEKFALVQPMLF